MRLRSERLQAHLERGLAPAYVVSGDEPLQKGETMDAIRAAARRGGFSERVVLDVEAGFDWGEFARHCDSLSLFSERRVLDVRVAAGKLSAAGADALVRYAERPPPENLLLLSTPRLDARELGSRWYRALEGVGVAIAVWPVSARELPGWVAQRMDRLGLKATPEAAAALAERVEGNLLACVQEIRKLHMLHGDAPLDVDDVHASVAESARFDVFDLVDSALGGDAPRVLRIVRALREEGVEPLPVLGTLAWTLRNMAEMAAETSDGSRGGAGRSGVLEARPAWKRRKRLVEAALERHGRAAWWRMLREAGRVDRTVKGGRSDPWGGDPWDGLQALALALAGVRVWRDDPHTEPV